MSINGVNNNPLLNGLSGLRPGQAGGTQPGQLRPGVARPGTPAQTGAAALKPQPSLAAPAQSLPAEAPAGTDPALWSVLTTEERAFFAKAAASGPLTYGRAAAGINGANAMAQNAGNSAYAGLRGGRLDVRG
ncbi:MAG: hypothetical protein JO180_12455 [Gemmatirosa sp.]|nr:hypothetical protein [Gemmatirosa sp.]